MQPFFHTKGTQIVQITHKEVNFEINRGDFELYACTQNIHAKN